MILFQCPHCGLQTRVGAKFAGQSGPCAGCSQRVTIPLASATPEAGRRRSQSPRSMTLALSLAAAILTLLLLAAAVRQVVQPAVLTAQRRAQRHICQSRVERLVSAMYAYQADHGTFPPAYSVDEQGAALHSWRVLILPYLGPEAQAVYTQLRLHEPWDSPHNQAYAPYIPDAFVCPHDQPFAVGDTSYCVPVGPEYAFRSGRGLRLSDIVDHPSTTILIMETHNSRINWMRPADLTSVELTQGINSGIPRTAGSDHQGETITVGTSDGRARPLSVASSPLVLHQMATINGGESPQPAFAR